MADENFWMVFINIVRFASIYWFSKCMKTLICGLCLIPVILLVHRVLRKRGAVLSCYLWMLLVPMAFMGMNRLFYQRYFLYVSAYLAKYIKEWHGYLYFGVMFLLFAVFLVRTVGFRKKLEEMPQINDTSVINEFAKGFGARYLRSVKLYCSDTDESPYSGGILKPYIVVPQRTWNNLDEKSRTVILCHELTHIRSGHIVLLTAFKFLTFLWWINPFIYLCENLLREDIEIACDECTIARMGITKHTYGCVLLGMIEHLNKNPDIAIASFVDRNDFLVLKKRIQYIGKKRTDSVSVSRQMCVGIGGIICLLCVSLGLIIGTSYPRYTVLEEIYVYGEDFGLIACDTPSVNGAFRVEGRELYIDEEGFQRFLAEEEVAGDYVYVSFGTVMKLPGYGGCGDAVMVNVKDSSDVWYLAADTIGNRVSELLLKWI